MTRGRGGASEATAGVGTCTSIPSMPPERLLFQAEPGTAAACFFADVFAVRSLYPNATCVPRELFLSRRLNANFEELMCPFGCETVAPTKAAVQRHGVRMHKFKRVGKPAQPTQKKKKDYVPLFEVSEILKRANSDSVEFVVAATYNTFEWRTLPLDHDKMKDFLSKVPEDPVAMPYGLPLVNLQAWVSGGVLAENDEQIDDMTSEYGWIVYACIDKQCQEAQNPCLR